MQSHSSTIAFPPAGVEPGSLPAGGLKGGNSEGVTPLMYACQQGNLQEIRTLIQKKASTLKDRDRTGKCALHYCAENTGIGCIDLLLEADAALLNASDEEGYTPLHLAVISGNRVVIRHFLSKGADINCLDNERHSVVHWATVCGELDALQLVLEAGADAGTADVHGAYPLHYAAQMCGQRNPVVGAVRDVRDSRVGLAALKQLLNHNVAVDIVDRDGRQPLLWAASAGSSDAILALVNAGASVAATDKDGLTALHCAASRGHSECLETLVALCGADVDIVDTNGCTALFYAVTLGHADCAELLLNYGSDPSQQDKKGRTAAHCGAAKGQLETLKLLLKHEANLWLRNTRGEVPLHDAVASGRKELVRWLLRLRMGAANMASTEGKSALHVAALNNNVEMCKILIDYEADVNPIMRGAKGQLMTPLDAALQKGNRGCAKFLQLHGGLPAARITDSKALSRALSQALNESQRGLMISRRDYLGSEMSSLPPSLDASYSKSQLQMPILEDSATQTQLEELSEEGSLQARKSVGGIEVEESARKRRNRRRAPRRSFSESSKVLNDKELRSRRRNEGLEDQDSEESTEESELGHEGDDASTVVLEPDGRLMVSTDDTKTSTSPVDKSYTEALRKLPGEASGKEGQTEDEIIHARASVLSHVGTESSGLKDSGYSDILGPLMSEREDFSEDDQRLLTQSQASPLVNGIQASIPVEEVPPGPSEEEVLMGARATLKKSQSFREKGRGTSSSLSNPEVSAGGQSQFRRTKSERIRSKSSISSPKLEEISEQPLGGTKGSKLRKNPISNTRASQMAQRKYQLEKKIFQQLLDLKQLQIRSGQTTNEQVFAKRLIESFKKEGQEVGLRPYDGPYSFKSLEKYLYDQLRTLQGVQGQRLLPEVDSSNGENGSTPRRKSTTVPANCTHATLHCNHAHHAYTGIPCAAYIPYRNHHGAPKPAAARTTLPRIKENNLISSNSSYLNLSAEPVTVELRTGVDRQLITLPLDSLEKSKKYQLTFTVKPGTAGKGANSETGTANGDDLRHQHAQSL